MTNLEKYLHQLRRIEEHRSKGAEKEIRRLYKQVLKDLNSFLTNIYIHYSEDDMLTFGNLAKAGMDARFLEEVEQRINGISSNVAKTIHDTVEQTYEACYDGMRNAVVKAAGNRELLKTALSTVAAVTPDVIRAAVNNPISGLTLNDTLEKHRKEIIYDIKRNIGVGLSNGDRFTTMAKRISQSVDADYNKAIRIVRTEAHRVREAGFHDSATAINDTLKQGESGYVMAKTWKTMKDERVRPNTVYKTKKGWKKGRKSKYNHEKMDGVTIPVEEEFKLPSGAKGKAPSQTGVAGEDINCRCYLSYGLVEVGVLGKGQKKLMLDGESKKYFENDLKNVIIELKADINKMITPYEKKVLDAIPKKAGFFDFAAHGSPNSIEYGSRDKVLSAREVARIIKHSDKYNGEKVRLLSCSTGAVGNGFAQQLANALGVEVEAPSDILIVAPNGRYKIGYDGSGEMKTFKPNGREWYK